jgi:hypothetical protein
VGDRAIRISAGRVTVEAALNDSRTARLIWEALPIEAAAQTWGDEIYFGIDVEAKAEQPREVVALGDLAYWPPGRAFCIFFGKTPASRGDEIRPASAVTVVGAVRGDPRVFTRVADGTRIRIDRGAPA